MYHRILKFNPNHDERGRFAQAGQGQGVEFVSPNVTEGNDVRGAQTSMGEPRHREVLQVANDVDHLLGLKSEHSSGIGAWSDGAEDTIVSRLSGNPTYEQVQLSAAMKGMLADQKAVIPFKVGPGSDSLFKVKVAGTDPVKIHNDFLASGLEFHTLVQHDNHTDVYIFDPGNQLKRKVQEAGAKHGQEISQWKGRGEFLGSWSDREEGKHAYQAIIDANLRPDQRGQWDSLYSRWRAKHPVVKEDEDLTLCDILKFDINEPRDWHGRWQGGGQEGVVNRIDRTVSPKEKVSQLSKLTAENKPKIDDMLHRIDAEFGTVSKSNVKADDMILAKATRPSILAAKPWHDVEHIRDSLRFKTVVDNLNQLPRIVQRVREDGLQFVKRDVEKQLNPKEWGWRIAAFDLRAKNGQLIEWYTPVRELEVAKKDTGHALFEKWRNVDLSKATPEQNIAFKKDRAASVALYDSAWQSYLKRTGQDASAVRASLEAALAAASKRSNIKKDSDAVN